MHFNRGLYRLTHSDTSKVSEERHWFTLKTLEFSAKRLKKNGHLCVLIGNPKMNGTEVEIWKIVFEYFVNYLHFKPVEAYEDIIKTRKLFNGRNNPNPSGMKSEFMIILKK